MLISCVNDNNNNNNNNNNNDNDNNNVDISSPTLICILVIRLAHPGENTKL